MTKLSQVVLFLLVCLSLRAVVVHAEDLFLRTVTHTEQTFTQAALELDVEKLSLKPELDRDCKRRDVSGVVVWLNATVAYLRAENLYQASEQAFCRIRTNTLMDNELEDEGGSGSMVSHWEKRLHFDEAMTAAGGGGSIGVLNAYTLPNTAISAPVAPTATPTYAVPGLPRTP